MASKGCRLNGTEGQPHGAGDPAAAGSVGLRWSTRRAARRCLRAVPPGAGIAVRAAN